MAKEKIPKGEKLYTEIMNCIFKYNMTHVEVLGTIELVRYMLYKGIDNLYKGIEEAEKNVQHKDNKQ